LLYIIYFLSLNVPEVPKYRQKPPAVGEKVLQQVQTLPAVGEKVLQQVQTLPAVGEKVLQQVQTLPAVGAKERSLWSRFGKL
jgi:hypothetical protein